MGSAQVRLAWTSPTLTSCFKQSEPDSPPSPLTTPTCLTRSSTRRRKSRRARKRSLRRRKRRKKNMKKRCRQTQTSENQFEARCLKEMETSSRPDRKLKRGSWTSSCESTSTSGGSSEPRKRKSLRD